MAPIATWLLLPLLLLADGDATTPKLGRPFGALLGESTLAIKGWPVTKGPDGPCGKPRAYWKVEYVFKGDKSLVGKTIPIYGTAPINTEPRTTALFLKGRTDCPEPFAQEEIGVDTIIRSAASPADCDLQLRAIQQILRGLATDCDTDTECAAYTFHPNSCERPRPYSVRAKEALPAFWKALADRARQACGPTWSKQPACAPIVMPVHCHEHRCLEGPSLAQAPAFARATLSESCAPWDGPAIAAMIRPQDKEYPRISINWWREKRPSRNTAGVFPLESVSSANYCPYENGCQMLHVTKFTMKLEADGKGTLELEAETDKGEKLSATVPVVFGPMQRVFCG